MSATVQAIRSHLLSSPEVSSLTSLRRFTSLFSQGQSADALFFIDEGMVKLTRTNDSGDRLILAICGAGDLIGEEAMSSASANYQADAEVLTAATVYRIPRETLRRALVQNCELAYAVIDFLMQLRQTYASKVELLCLHDVEYRVLFHLAELSKLVGSGGLNDGYQLPITQAELADLIGATRETTSTTLNQLERRGLVKLSRRLLTVHSPGVLRSTAAQRKSLAAKARTA